MSGRPLVIVGASGHGRVVAEAAACGGFIVQGFLDDFAAPGTASGRWSVLGGCPHLPALCRQIPALTVAIAIGHNHDRRTVAARVRTLCPEIELTTIIHPSAVVAADARIGEGCFVGAGAVIQPMATLQPLTLINTRCIVEHDVQTGMASSLGPGAVMGGWARIGEETALQLGALVRDRRCVGSFTVVGMGSVVTTDLPEGCVAWGNPARWQRARIATDPVL